MTIVAASFIYLYNTTISCETVKAEMSANSKKSCRTESHFLSVRKFATDSSNNSKCSRSWTQLATLTKIFKFLAIAQVSPHILKVQG